MSTRRIALFLFGLLCVGVAIWIIPYFFPNYPNLNPSQASLRVLLLFVLETMALVSVWFSLLLPRGALDSGDALLRALNLKQNEIGPYTGKKPARRPILLAGVFFIIALVCLILWYYQ